MLSLSGIVIARGLAARVGLRLAAHVIARSSTARISAAHSTTAHGSSARRSVTVRGKLLSHHLIKGGGAIRPVLARLLSRGGVQMHLVRLV